MYNNAYRLCGWVVLMLSFMQQGKRTMLACALTYGFCDGKKERVMTRQQHRMLFIQCINICSIFSYKPSPLMVTIFSLVHPSPPKLVVCATLSYMRVTL